MGRLQIVFALALLLTTSIHNRAQAQHDGSHIDFATSCGAETDADFGEAVTLLHHMMYEQSEQAFRRVAEADSSCAMAYWGIAMTQLHPLWAPPTEAELAEGAEAAGRAAEIGAPTGREIAFIDAIGAFFLTPGDFGTRVAAWDAAQKELHDAYPADVDAGAFYALAHLTTAPKDDKTFSQQQEVGRLLERLLAEAPQHPGLFHYTIHAYDNPMYADRAVQVARGYDKLAPEVPHALHMPSHIFVRLGLWEDVASWNRRSADAALKHRVDGIAPLHYPHAIDYLVYARLQQGRDSAAAEAVEELLGTGTFQPTLATAYGIAAPPARVALERRAWTEAAALPVRNPGNFPWEQFPAAESITWYAKGLGAARSGDVQAARRALETLDTLHTRLTDAGEAYWAILTEAQQMAVDAWVQYADDKKEEALALMRRSADLEDSVDKHPVTPGSVLPARELLGEMYLLEGLHAEAIEAFEASLEISRGRLNSVTGAGRAAQLMGDRETAESYYSQAIDITANAANVQRPRFDSVHSFAGSK